MDAGTVRPMLIDGQWVGAAESIAVVDPSTEEVIAQVAAAGAEQVGAALASARTGFDTWRARSAWERSAVLRDMATRIRAAEADLAAIITAEQGKPSAQALGEVRATADQFDWCADEARRVYGRIVPAQNPSDRIHVYLEPIGPVLAFAPWNFPMLLPGRKIAAALAAGCSVLVVAPVEAPLSSLALGRIGLQAGLPAGALNVLTGDPARLAGPLIDSPVVRKVSVTSSVPVGVQTMARAAQSVKPVTLELGGHAPVIVLPGSGVGAAARVCALGKFRNGGQVCISASRFIVAEFVATTEALVVGPAGDDGVDVGPLGSARRRAAIEELVADATSLGAELVTGGGRPAGLAKGFFYAPTILLGATAEMKVMNEEPFGPIAPVQTFSTIDEALHLANRTPFGLAGFVFSDDLALALRIAERLDVGMVGINNLTIATAEAPFGGVKHSGFGREGGTEGIAEFLTTKYVNARMAEPEVGA